MWVKPLTQGLAQSRVNTLPSLQSSRIPLTELTLERAVDLVKHGQT